VEDRQIEDKTIAVQMLDVTNNDIREASV